MRVFGVSMIKDEADVIEDTILHLLGEDLDGLIVADNASTDGTRDILARLADVYDELTVVDEPDPAYYQSLRMTALASVAHDAGADWIVPFDADELWYANDQPLAAALRTIGNTLRVVQAPLFNHFPTGVDDPAVKHPFQRLRWRLPDPGALPKVCVRWRDDCTIEQGNHSATFASGIMPHESAAAGVALRHFPYRSADHFVTKAENGAKAYAATDLPDYQGAHWRQYGRILELHGPEALREVFEKHFYYLAPAQGGLVEDPAPFRRWAAES